MNATVLIKNRDNVDISSVSKMTDVFRNYYIKIWWKASVDMPVICKTYDHIQKREKQKETDFFVKEMVELFKAFSQEEHEMVKWRASVMRNARVFARETLQFRKEYMDIIFSEDFIESTICFIRKAKDFAQTMKIEDIFQAIRNVWIMNSIQVFLNKSVGFSNSIFSYSLLYPYADNYLDSNEIKLDEKKKISENFRGCFAGHHMKPSTDYENQLFALVAGIEKDYPGSVYPKVYESLLGIHDAQQNSLMQQGKRVVPYEMDIMGISFQKGGMSVLTDAYLINGDLSIREAEFMFGFGILLQLADDLQDVSTDAENGHMTIFSQIAGKWPLDSVTNKLLNLVEEVMDSADSFDSSVSNHLKELIKHNCNFLIMQAVAKNQKYYTKEYIKKIEKYSIFEFSYMKKLYSKLHREYRGFENNKRYLSIDEMIYTAIGV